MPERVYLFQQASILVRPHSVLQIHRADLVEPAGTAPASDCFPV